MYLDTKAWLVERGISGEALLKQLELEKIQGLYQLIGFVGAIVCGSLLIAFYVWRITR